MALAAQYPWVGFTVWRLSTEAGELGSRKIGAFFLAGPLNIQPRSSTIVQVLNLPQKLTGSSLGPQDVHHMVLRTFRWQSLMGKFQVRIRLQWHLWDSSLFTHSPFLPSHKKSGSALPSLCCRSQVGSNDSRTEFSNSMRYDKPSFFEI